MGSFSELKAKLDHELRWRRRACRALTLGRHLLEREAFEAHAGPIGFEESEDTRIGSWRQCRICFECVDR